MAPSKLSLSGGGGNNAGSAGHSRLVWLCEDGGAAHNSRGTEVVTRSLRRRDCLDNLKDNDRQVTIKKAVRQPSSSMTTRQ